MKKRVFLALILSVLSSALYAAEVSGKIVLKRNAAKKISEAYIKTNKNDPSGSPVQYKLLLDNNGKYIAFYSEHKWLKISGEIRGRTIKADTWEEIQNPEYAYIKNEAPLPAEVNEEEVQNEEYKNFLGSMAERLAGDDKDEDEKREILAEIIEELRYERDEYDGMSEEEATQKFFADVQKFHKEDAAINKKNKNSGSSDYGDEDAENSEDYTEEPDYSKEEDY